MFMLILLLCLSLSLAVCHCSEDSSVETTTVRSINLCAWRETISCCPRNRRCRNDFRYESIRRGGGPTSEEEEEEEEEKGETIAIIAKIRKRAH